MCINKKGTPDPSNIDGSSQQHIGGSSSLTPASSSIHQYSVDDIPMYEPQLSPSMPNTVGEDFLSKKSCPQTRSRQKDVKKGRLKMTMKVKGAFHGPPEEETALCKGWFHVSEDNFVGNTRKETGFWTTILAYVEQK